MSEKTAPFFLFSECGATLAEVALRLMKPAVTHLQPAKADGPN